MKGLRSVVATTLALFLVFSFIGNSNSAPQEDCRLAWETPHGLVNPTTAPKPMRRGGPGAGRYWLGAAGAGSARAGPGSAQTGVGAGLVWGRAAQGRGSGKGRLVQSGGARRAPENRLSRADPGRRRGPTPPDLGTRGAEPILTAIVECLAGQLSPAYRLCRGAPLHLGPESEEGPLGPAAPGKTKSKSPTTNSSRDSSSATGFLAETTRSWRRKL